MNFLVLKIILLRNQNDDYRDYVRSRIYIIFLPKSESVDRVTFTKHVYCMYATTEIQHHANNIMERRSNYSVVFA